MWSTCSKWQQWTRWAQVLHLTTLDTSRSQRLFLQSLQQFRSLSRVLWLVLNKQLHYPVSLEEFQNLKSSGWYYSGRWFLSDICDATSHWLVYHINIAHSTNNPHVQWSRGRKWPWLPSCLLSSGNEVLLTWKLSNLVSWFRFWADVPQVCLLHMNSWKISELIKYGDSIHNIICNSVIELVNIEWTYHVPTE